MQTLNEASNYLGKILIVDDLPDNLKVIGSILMAEKFRVIVAPNGEEALRLAGLEQPDLILLDVQMPEMDGYEVCKKLKENPLTREIPIIFLTAKSASDDVVKGFDLGGEDYVTKPFQTKELLARVRTHLRLRFTSQKLIELNATKDKFFSIIAHDLRNPFNHILGFTNILVTNLDEYEKPQLKNILVTLNNSATSAYNLLENLLIWASSQRGKIVYSPCEIELQELISEELMNLSEIAINKGIILQNLILEPLFAYADRNMLKTIFRNLITNSLKFTAKGGYVSINAKLIADKIEISVSDSGVGMDLETQGKLFKNNQMITSKGTNDEKGTGLGLMLCKEFIMKHGGEIWVNSEPGHGTEIKFSLHKNRVQAGGM